MELELDVQDYSNFIHNEEFHVYLLAHTADFSTAAFILETLLSKETELMRLLDNQE